MTRPSFPSEIDSYARPAFPPLRHAHIPPLIADEDSAAAALESLRTIDTNASELRAFLRAGAAYRRETGRAIPAAEWSKAHDVLDSLARMRQRVQEAVGRYRRDRRDTERASFERAFIEVARRELDVDRFAELALEAQRASRGAA